MPGHIQKKLQGIGVTNLETDCCAVATSLSLCQKERYLDQLSPPEVGTLVHDVPANPAPTAPPCIHTHIWCRQ